MSLDAILKAWFEPDIQLFSVWFHCLLDILILEHTMLSLNKAMTALFATG